MGSKLKSDKFLLINILLLLGFGIIIFLSASLGLLAKEGVKYSSIVLNQITFGLLAGGIASYIASKIPYKFWRKNSFYLFFCAFLVTCAVFIPGVGSKFGGASRWILLGPISFQPGEFLKITYIIYLAAWLSAPKHKIKTFLGGLLPFLIISALAGGVLLLQPDTDTALIMLVTGAVMFFVAGASIKHIISAGALFIGVFGIAILTRPYILARIWSIINPAANPLSTSYQIHQSLIAIGSGGLFGRGFGQSIQKFNFLPEPIGDSVFAVAAEEFGFIGAVILVLLFIVFLFRAVKIGSSHKDLYGGLLMIGFAILITSQSFLNIGSMLGIMPLSGLPLLFVSHGGTALFFTLFTTGIMLNISKSKKNKI